MFCNTKQQGKLISIRRGKIQIGVELWKEKKPNMHFFECSSFRQLSPCHATEPLAAMPFKDRHLKIHDSVEYGAILAARHTPGNERGGERGRQGKNLKGDNRDTKKHPSFVFSPSNFLFFGIRT